MADSDNIPGLVAAQEFARVRDGDPKATADAMEAIWRGLNEEIKNRRFAIQQTLTNTAILYGTHADRVASYPASSYSNGVLFFETDRKAMYVVSGGTWVWANGTMYAARASAPTDLGSDDNGFLLFVSDFAHLVRWTGTAWEFADGDVPGRVEGFAVNPGTGWVLCDGTASTYLTVGATLTATSITPPDLTAGAYPKFGAAYAGSVVAATAPTASVSGSTANAGATISGSTGSTSVNNATSNEGAAPVNADTNGDGSNAPVAPSGHSHPNDHGSHNHDKGTLAVDNHQHGAGTLAVTVGTGGEPARVVLRPYMRR